MSAALVAAVLTGSPALGQTTPDKNFELPKSSANKNTSRGKPSDLAVAAAKARNSKKRVEVTALRTTRETVWATPDGTITREIAQSPIRAKNAAGDLVAIDTTLGETDGELAPKATTGDVEFSGNGLGALAAYQVSKDTSVALSFGQALGAPKVEGSIASYPVDGSSDDRVQVYAKNDGFAAHVVLADAPKVQPAQDEDEQGEGSTPEPSITPTPTPTDPDQPREEDQRQEESAEDVEYRFGMDLKGLTPSLDDGIIRLTDAGGDVVAESRPLQMWDATRDEAGDPANPVPVDARLERTADGYDIVLTPSMDFLLDPATEYPVTIDPDIMAKANGDTYYYTGQSSSALKGTDSNLRIGSDDGSREFRSLLKWNYKSYLGTDVIKADLKLYQYFSGSAACTHLRTNLYPTTSDPVNIHWGNKPGISNSGVVQSFKSFNHGATGCGAAFETIDVTPMVNAWAAGHPDFYKPDPGPERSRQGMELRANDALSTSHRKSFCSDNPDAASTSCNTSARVPTLSVEYAPERGSQSWYSMTDHTLNDKSGISVNNKNGNAVIATSDININAVGLDIGLNRTYNSQSYDSPASPSTAPEPSSIGKGWSLSLGPDVWLEKMSQYRYDFHAPGGTVLGSFIRKTADTSSGQHNQFHTPLGGSRADLEQDGNKFILKFRGNRTKYIFEDNSPDNHAYLKSVQDRSDNTIDINYSGTTSTDKPKMTSIVNGNQTSSVSTDDQTLAVTYGTGAAADYVTKISHTYSNAPAAGTSTRDWEYGYDSSGYLTTATDAQNNSTTYDYDYVDPVTSTNLLTNITSPVNDSGRAPTTNIKYAYDAATETNQVIETSYVHGPNSADHYDYTWDYASGDPNRPTACKGKGTFFAEVVDPNSHTTTYCFDSRTDAGDGSKTWVYDGEGHARSIQFSVDNGPENVTNPSGQSSGASTVAQYATNRPDQLQKVTEPKGDADKGSSTGFAYNPSGNGGAYQPTAVQDGSGNCNRFGYDDKGRTTAAYTGIVATGEGANTCGSEGSGKEFHRNYNDNGTVSASWDANASSSPGDSEKTLYTYWQTGDSGYVDGTAGQVKTIRKPGGNCSATVAAGRKLCTSYTYDGAGRVASMTNGNAKRTNYTHDNLDRTTRVTFDGAIACNILTMADCHQYTYDAEGNLTSRTEGLLLSSTFDYDQMNRRIGQANPVGLLQPFDQLGMAYDGTGNLKTFNQSVGSVTDSVTYTYDAANRLNRVVDATGEIKIRADADGRTQSIEFPKPSGSAGMKVDYDYTDSGKPKALDVREHDDTSLASFEYDYEFTLFGLSVETPQMRNRDVVSSSISNIESNMEYEYTADSRLNRATDAAGSDYEYTYDNIGNIRSEKINSTTTRYGYNKAGELCWQGPNSDSEPDTEPPPTACDTTPSGNTALTRDRAGNNTKTASDPITYNERDQVTSIGGTTMTYRDLGNDLRQTAGSDRIVSGPMGITAVDKATGPTFYTRDPQGTILNSHGPAGTRNYVTEFNGSVAALFNPAGSDVASYKYSPYGATTVAAENGGTTAANNPFRYISGYQDKTSTGDDGYYKLGARYYDGHGHFTQPDPVLPGGGDYLYAATDPINFSDPAGLYPGENLVRLYGATSGLDAIVTARNEWQRGDRNGAIATLAGELAGGIVEGGCAVGVVRSGVPPLVVGCLFLGGQAEAIVGAAVDKDSKWYEYRH